MSRFYFATAFALGLGIAFPAQANIVTNGSFEDPAGPGPNGQGFLPAPWVTIPVGADTYSNTGNYGLSPSDFGNFTGVTAYDGQRWAAGWSAVPEIFGQVLATALQSGASYTFSGALHQALRSDLDHPGGYNLYAATGLDDATPIFLTSTGSTTSDLNWELFKVAFTAPDGVGARTFLLFKPFAQDAGAASYAGIDAIDLSPTGVPEADSWVALTIGFGVLGQTMRRSRRKTHLSPA